jgi:hypothetical protein
MIIDLNKFAATCLLFLFPLLVQAEDVDFSFGGGYPFIVVSEISIASEEKAQRWHANYKVGLDDGFTLGVEQSFSHNDKHSIGVIVGALGIKKENHRCQEQGSNLDCILSDIFDEETTVGLGLTYGYYFNRINATGWFLKVEAGYGEGKESDEKHADASVRISYQF